MMKIVDIAQRTPEWHEWRKGGISATSLAIILGKNPQKSRRQLWLELKGYATAPDLSVIPQVRKGAKLEPLALQAFEDAYGVIGLPICGQHEVYPWMRASFDGLLDGNDPVEIKNLADGNHLDVLDRRMESDAYQLYKWQVKHQLVVSGAKSGWLWFWSPRHSPIRLQVVLEEGEETFIVEQCRKFWQSVLDDEIPDADPALDPLPVEFLSDEEQQAWMTLSERRKELEKAIKQHEAAMKELQAQAKEQEQELFALMGDFKNADFNGVRITRYEIKGRVDWERIAREEIDSQRIERDLIPKHMKAPTQGCRISVNPEFVQPMSGTLIDLARRRTQRKEAAKAPPKTRVRNGFWF
jgi:putative phage-type endonuclease